MVGCRAPGWLKLHTKQAPDPQSKQPCLAWMLHTGEPGLPETHRPGASPLPADSAIMAAVAGIDLNRRRRYCCLLEAPQGCGRPDTRCRMVPGREVPCAGHVALGRLCSCHDAPRPPSAARPMMFQSCALCSPSRCCVLVAAPAPAWRNAAERRAQARCRANCSGLVHATPYAGRLPAAAQSSRAAAADWRWRAR